MAFGAIAVVHRTARVTRQQPHNRAAEETVRVARFEFEESVKVVQGTDVVLYFHPGKPAMEEWPWPCGPQHHAAESASIACG